MTVAVTELVVRLASGAELPLVGTPADVAPLLGRSDRTVRSGCEDGTIPTLTRASGSGARHRIPVARLLEELGVPFTIEPAAAPRGGS